MRKSWLTVAASTLLVSMLGIGIARADVLADVKKKGVLSQTFLKTIGLLP